MVDVADRVIVVSDGKIIQIGTYENLCVVDGPFKKMTVDTV
jgi:ABC-type multidrug transport system fused ATPase/permease subunit